MIPILCSVTLALNFIFAFINRRFTENGLVYLLLNIAVGVTPYIALTVMRARTPLTWVICLIVSVITFLGLVIFKGRALRAELEKTPAPVKGPRPGSLTPAVRRLFRQAVPRAPARGFLLPVCKKISAQHRHKNKNFPSFAKTGPAAAF